MVLALTGIGSGCDWVLITDVFQCLFADYSIRIAEYQTNGRLEEQKKKKNPKNTLATINQAKRAHYLLLMFFCRDGEIIRKIDKKKKKTTLHYYFYSNSLHVKLAEVKLKTQMHNSS